MKLAFLVVPAGLLAGVAVAQDAGRDPLDPQAKVPPVEYRSTFQSYRSFAEQELADWRRSNEEVGAAGGHAGLLRGQGAGEPTSKPQPGTPESSGGAAEKSRTPMHQGGHGVHK